MISCPTCGRTRVPLLEIAAKVENMIRDLPYDLKVAVMGCAVNGPGEAKEADVGIAGGDGEFLLFRKGVVVRKIRAEDVYDELVRTIRELGESGMRDETNDKIIRD